MKQELIKDFRDFIGLLNAKEVKYVLLGGYAMAWHGHPRYTGDIDFFIARSAQNAEALVKVMNEFGMASLGLTVNDFLEEGIVVQFGRAPYRVDLLTFADGLDFDETWESRVVADWEGVTVNVISRDMLIRNKLASGRGKDLEDAKTLVKRTSS
ncbi:MAG: hypothetical protein EOO11_15290 [Chitinophagaceae bacterium]|nr:MAG: hypothetical protein EOO11_15290 [Chitinophagaceae bacterium]